MKRFDRLTKGDVVTLPFVAPNGTLTRLVQGEVTRRTRDTLYVCPLGKRKPVSFTRDQVAEATQNLAVI